MSLDVYFHLEVHMNLVHSYELVYFFNILRTIILTENGMGMRFKNTEL